MTEKAWTKYAGPAALVGAGLVAGGVLAASLSASAETPAPTSTAAAGSDAAGESHGDGNPAHSQRADEKLLTGDTATKVRAAALAKYPGATIERAESDSDGVYEAHLVTAAGDHVTVEVDKAFKVTGLEAHGPGGPGGHHGRPNDNDADDQATTGTNG